MWLFNCVIICMRRWQKLEYLNTVWLRDSNGDSLVLNKPSSLLALDMSAEEL